MLIWIIIIQLVCHYILKCHVLFFPLKSKELKSLVYGAMVSVALYLYLMHYVTEETQRVAYLGFACMFFTVAMQASPLAVVVCKLNSFFNTLYCTVVWEGGQGETMAGHNSYDIWHGNGMNGMSEIKTCDIIIVFLKMTADRFCRLKTDVFSDISSSYFVLFGRFSVDWLLVVVHRCTFFK